MKKSPGWFSSDPAAAWRSCSGDIAIAIAYIEGIVVIPRPLGIISRRPCTRVPRRPRRHATQRARSEIFKLSE